MDGIIAILCLMLGIIFAACSICFWDERASSLEYRSPMGAILSGLTSLFFFFCFFSLIQS